MTTNPFPLLQISLSTICFPAERGKDLTSPLNLRSICVFLHILLVLLHVLMFVIWWYRFEHKLVVPLSKSGITSSAIVVISQCVGVVREINIYAKLL